MKGFKKQASGLRRLNAKVLALDMRWLNELTAEDWKRAVNELQKNISDSVINKAVQKIPAEVYAFSGKNIVSKLKTRRDGLTKHAMRYYEFLSAQPRIIGTEEQDVFRVSATNAGITIGVHQQGKNKNEKVIYQRKFSPRETRKIFITGLGGNDRFIVDQNVFSSIKLHLEGGDGNDEYSVKGKIKARIYDTNKSNARASLAHK